MPIKKIAIIGAGPAGLMAADVLSQSTTDYDVHVFEQKPSAARKFLMAGKTGLNISHAEAFEQFIQRYDHVEWLRPWVEKWDATWIQSWMHGLGIESYVGSSGRVFSCRNEGRAFVTCLVKAVGSAARSISLSSSNNRFKAATTRNS